MGKDPRETERALWAVASEQVGYFTAAQALAVGYSYPQQHFHCERGNWLRVDRGVFRLREYPPSAHEDLVRWALWSRDRKGRVRAVVSHDTALSLHELGDIMAGMVHLTVPPGFRKHPSGGCVLHRAALPTADIERRDGFLVTTPLRTLLDVAESDLSPEHLTGAVRDALARGVVRRSNLLSAELSPDPRQRLLEALLAVSEVAS
jgi:predicted transcriptional regulator of viral defense system